MAISKEDLWALYVKRNPHWETEGVTLTPAGIRKLFEQTFDLGHELGFENGQARARREDSAFDRIFDRYR